MAIWIDKATRVIAQGITGKAGHFHTLQCKQYGTQIVGGVTPGKGGTLIDNIPVFDSVKEARKATHCTATMIFVPAPFAKDAILEAEAAGIELIVCITEGIPIQDMLEVSRVMKYSPSRLIGPNCPGLITPGACKIGIMPGYIHQEGYVGIVSRSGTLTYEAVWQTSQLKMGQSTCVGIGGDPLSGTQFVHVLEAFERDVLTRAILLIGEIGGDGEELAAAWIEEKGTKPVAAFIAGLSAPMGRRMGHAGAVVSPFEGGANHKIQALASAGVEIALSPADMGFAVQRALERHSRS